MVDPELTGPISTRPENSPGSCFSMIMASTVPNRSNYIHWVEDLLSSDIIPKNSNDGDIVRGFDIGTGANCIYPLLGASLLGWTFVGRDRCSIGMGREKC
uniref:Methyltransferase n=1 Tax=Salix viminalis TaxID=40686 RepID=A0A6N2LMJ7_SALVM